MDISGLNSARRLLSDTETNRCIGRAASTFATLIKRFLENGKLTIHPKVAVYRASVLSTLLYGSEPWTLYSRLEKRLLAQAGIQSLYILLQQRRLCWLGHVHRMPDERIPKDLLYGELATGKRMCGRPSTLQGHLQKGPEVNGH